MLGHKRAARALVRIRLPAGAGVPLGFLVVGILLFIYTLVMERPSGGVQALGPAFWPQLLLLNFLVACLVDLVQVFRRRRAPQGTEFAGMGTGIEPGRIQWKVWAAIGLLFVFVIGHVVLGFMLATVLFLIAFSTLWGGGRPAIIVAVSLIGTVGLMYLFVKVVYLPFPKGYGVVEDVTIFLYRLLGIF